MFLFALFLLCHLLFSHSPLFFSLLYYLSQSLCSLSLDDNAKLPTRVNMSDKSLNTTIQHTLKDFYPRTYFVKLLKLSFIVFSCERKATLLHTTSNVAWIPSWIPCKKQKKNKKKNNKKNNNKKPPKKPPKKQTNCIT